MQVAGLRRCVEPVETSEPDAGGDIVLCMSQLNLSVRAYHLTRSVKLARTIADLARSEEIQSAHLAEALHATQSSEDHDG